MMGFISTSRSFRTNLGYCLEDKKQEQNQQTVFKDRAEVLYYHQCYGNKEELSRQFSEVASLNQQISKPTMHISLSLPPGESLRKSQWVDMVRECSRHMNFEKHQYVVILHKDTTHQHVHVLVNRVGFDKHVTSDSFTYLRLNQFCRDAEVRHHLTQTLNPLRYRSEEEREVPRHDLRLDNLKEDIRQSLLLSRDFDGFHKEMGERGYTVYQKQMGVAFRFDKYVVFRGYEAGYPLHKIQSILSQDLSLRQEEEQRQRLAKELRLQEEERLRQGEGHHQRHSLKLNL